MLRSSSWLALVAVAGWPGSGLASPPRNFTAHLTDCSEFVGWGPIALADAKPLVPTGYTIAGAATGTAAIVVRVTHCASLQVHGTPPIPTNLSQIGINLVSPDGTGDINNYTLVYASNNPFLVAAFILSGLPARYDPDMSYDFTPIQSGAPSEFYASVAPAGLPAWFFHGTETPPPPDSATLFTANWWSGPNALLKQSTTFPQISFGTANVTFYTSRGSEFGTLIGGNTDSNFSILSVRGVYPSADLAVAQLPR